MFMLCVWRIRVFVVKTDEIVRLTRSVRHDHKCHMMKYSFPSGTSSLGHTKASNSGAPAVRAFCTSATNLFALFAASRARGSTCFAK